jgi:hypothetical protein
LSCAWWGPGLVARILSLSWLVGMECPGLHSLFSSFDVEISAASQETPLRFAVARVDTRFSLVQMGIEGGGLHGTVEAFIRPPPTRQSSVEAIAAKVRRDEFAQQRALIIGGSRGLGEATAKIIGSGGGQALVTYHSGEDDARRVKREINHWGGDCEIAMLDVQERHTTLGATASSG